MSRVFGYLRVSTTKQELEKNKNDILNLCNDKKLGNVDWIEETASGTIHWKKRQLGNIIQNAESGDVIILSELSRLGRSMLEIMEILSIAMEKGVRIYTIKGTWTLDNTLQSKIIAMVFAMASEIERDLISARTKESLKYVKEHGSKSGKPIGRQAGQGKSRLDEHREDIEYLLSIGASQTYIASKYNTVESNLRKYMRKHGLIKNRASK